MGWIILTLPDADTPQGVTAFVGHNGERAETSSSNVERVSVPSLVARRSSRRGSATLRGRSPGP
ncbi:hypothetical protein [uncultured Georgenia sp.]|uniref:hypothetical protein n=1 Tax=uncultured Georgenia sp. TaxID=378209 RepID=UPI0026232952|nr:hypothetical protein [uncultured Georgenia sp.]HLV04743.1 hypothetical protein [Actinomycetaceae bacterium]